MSGDLRRAYRAPHEYYAAALDEIYRLRTLLAVEGSILANHLDYKSFPKSRRKIAEAQVSRMYLAARGESEDAIAEHPKMRRRQCRTDAGMPETLTRAAWEAASGEADSGPTPLTATVLPADVVTCIKCGVQQTHRLCRACWDRLCDEPVTP